MDKTFQQLKTRLIDLCHGASSSSCEIFFTEFEEKYTTLKGFFLGSSGKPLRMHEEGTKNDILSCERSLEDKDNNKEMNIMFTLCQLTSYALRTWMERMKIHVLHQLKCISFQTKMLIFYHYQSKELEEIMERYVS